MEESGIEKFLDSLLSKRVSGITLIILILVGLILCLISSLSGVVGSKFIMALGISIIVGAVLGGLTGLKIGWPLGRWVGLVGGLMISPFLALLLNDVITAYYASFLGPFFGILIGIVSECEERKEIHETIEKIRSKVR